MDLKTPNAEPVEITTKTPKVVSRLSIEGACMIQHVAHHDERGTFMEIFRDEHFKGMELPTEWVQDNIARSNKGSLRGLHIQKNNPQGKLVRCLVGLIWDVIVDLRPDSPTFKKWCAVSLSDQLTNAVYVPPGCAHGYVTLSETSMVHYKCTTRYDRWSDGGINAFDPELDIPWPMARVLVSKKDRTLPMMADYLSQK